VTSSYATTPLLFEQRTYQAYGGDYAAVCIYQYPLFILDKNKHEVSDQTYNCPHNTKLEGVEISRESKVLILVAEGG